MFDVPSQLEVGAISLNHFGEELCGDHVESHLSDDGRLTFVLADGLGSGISVRPDFSFKIYNNDNPTPVLLRNGKNTELEWDERHIEGKIVKVATGKLELYDQIILMSDGAIYAGVGETLNFGWTRKEIIDYAEALYYKEITATNMASSIIEHCDVLYNHREGDDTTVCSIRRRPKEYVNVMIGPATNYDDDKMMLDGFFNKPGKHIVSGGSTAMMVARYLGVDIDTTLEFFDPEIPPTSHIEGVDLVTEGVITMNRVVLLAKDYLDKDKKYFDWCFKQDGASLLARALFQDATDINFYVGCAVNPAHQNPKLGIAINTKMKLVDELAKHLKKMGKTIRVFYF